MYMYTLHIWSYLYYDLSTDDSQQSSIHNVTDNQHADATTTEHEREALGEQIYLTIVTKCPSQAPKITGMFLEMDIESLKETIENSELFNKKLADAIRVLEEVEHKNSDKINGSLNGVIDVNKGTVLHVHNGSDTLVT